METLQAGYLECYFRPTDHFNMSVGISCDNHGTCYKAEYSLSQFLFVAAPIVVVASHTQKILLCDHRITGYLTNTLLKLLAYRIENSNQGWVSISLLRFHKTTFILETMSAGKRQAQVLWKMGVQAVTKIRPMDVSQPSTLTIQTQFTIKIKFAF